MLVQSVPHQYHAFKFDDNLHILYKQLRAIDDRFTYGVLEHKDGTKSKAIFHKGNKILAHYKKAIWVHDRTLKFWKQIQVPCYIVVRLNPDRITVVTENQFNELFIPIN